MLKHTPKSNSPWHDDVLGRKTLGKTLEDHLINRFIAGNHEPLALALDGRWGSGKTFFVERWTQQLINNNRFVITFNAWQHDRAPEPSLALISELRRQLQDLSQRTIPSILVNNSIDEKLKLTVSSAKKAIKPMLATVVSGLLKRTIGSSFSDFTAAISDEEQEPTYKDNTEILEKALDIYFDKMLADYELHQASIARFQDDLTNLADTVSKVKTADNQPIGPIIIIIDELDRCRPDFAVQLLEGIKHLFSVKNVCFIFATNLTQLSASIQAVYGANFSGREYLGRFFDRELTLPILSGDSFSQLLFQSPLPTNLSMGSFRINGKEKKRPETTYWIALSQWIGLTLRQQKQAFITFQTSCEAYQKNTPIPGVWLMFLAQLKTAFPEIFSTLHEISDKDAYHTTLHNLLSDTSWSNKTLFNLQNPKLSVSENVDLSSLLGSFFSYSKMSAKEAIEALRYDHEFKQEIEEFLLPSIKTQENLLESTFDIIATAGIFSYPESDTL